MKQASEYYHQLEMKDFAANKQAVANGIFDLLKEIQYKSLKLKFYENSLNRIVFVDINLTDSDIKRSVFSLSTIQETKFDHSTIIDTVFTFSDFTKSSFVGCNITASLFDYATLKDVNFSGSELKDVFLQGRI